MTSVRPKWIEWTLCLSLVAYALSGCASVPISANPIQDIVAMTPKLTGPLSISDGLKEAAFNLDNAVLVGALDATDPAPGCVHDAMRALGLDPLVKPLPSFVPETSTLMGEGSVAYIRAKQTQRLQGAGVNVSVNCKAFIGEIVLAAGRGAAKIQPGGGLLVPLR